MALALWLEPLESGLPLELLDSPLQQVQLDLRRHSSLEQGPDPVARGPGLQQKQQLALD